MPSLLKIKKNAEKKFKKVDYRPWNNPAGGHETANTTNKAEGGAELKILEIPPNEIQNWYLHDRSEVELGDIKALSRDLENIGQQQPCIVRKNKSLSKFKYELIVGERRWRAAKLANIKLKVIVKDIDDKEAALIQFAENDNRKDLSEYSKGIQYSKLIKMGIITQKDITKTLGKSKQYVSALLAFDKIPRQIVKAIGDMSKVSSRTAETIKQLSNKSRKHTELIIMQAKLIREGKIGNRAIINWVNKHINAEGTGKVEEKNSFPDNKLFTYAKSKNGDVTLQIPKKLFARINLENFCAKLNLLIQEMTK